MTAGRQIPSQIWKDPSVASTTEAFMEGAGLDSPPRPSQSLLCAFCAAEGDESTPDTIVFIKGTSLCINHSKNMLN